MPLKETRNTVVQMTLRGDRKQILTNSINLERCIEVISGSTNKPIPSVSDDPEADTSYHRKWHY